jgi:hypothetical protein
LDSQKGKRKLMAKYQPPQGFAGLSGAEPAPRAEEVPPLPPREPWDAATNAGMGDPRHVKRR